MNELGGAISSSARAIEVPSSRRIVLRSATALSRMKA
jgi:hypothetical protein